MSESAKLDSGTGLWKENLQAARQSLIDWWNGKGLALAVRSPRDRPIETFENPGPPQSPEQAWLDPVWRLKSNLHSLSNTFFGGAALPMFRSDIGPGSLGLFLGCGGHTAPDTVWYEAVIADTDSSEPLVADLSSEWWQRHIAVINEGKRYARGRYLVGYPDLVENIDTLAQLRDPQTLMMDLIENPEWVCYRIWEINAAYFQVYDAMTRQCDLVDEWGGTTFDCFGIWGLGKTAKVQCDFSCMISPAMYRKFVLPAMAAQCAWLDNSLYHLDGENAIPQLDNILSIDGLNAVQWTPGAGRPSPGSPVWYDLYRRIKQGGKSVQALGVRLNEVEPLIDAVGSEGLMVVTSAPSEAEARALLERVGMAA